MNSYGFVKVATAIPTVKIANCKANAQSIITLANQANAQHVQFLCFPELCITAYTCADLFHQQVLLNDAIKALNLILQETKDLDMILMVGLPIDVNGSLYNCAAVLQHGTILGIVPKRYLPNHNEFYEQRWFASSIDNQETSLNISDQEVPFGDDLLFKHHNLTFSVELCEDLWSTIPPSSYQALAGSQLIFNLSASDELIGKANYREELIKQQSARCIAGYVYVSAGFGESSTDVLYAGCSTIAENSTILARAKRFLLEPQLIISEIDIERIEHDRQKNSSFKRGLKGTFTGDYHFRNIAYTWPSLSDFKLSRKVDSLPFVPSGTELDERCQEITDIQANALAVRLSHTGIRSVVVGISGGLDSTLALLVCVAAFDRLKIDRKNIIGITMPGFGTTGRTYNNAVDLMKALGITTKEINIKEACMLHFEKIGHSSEVHDITYENTQARMRTLYLMNIANQNNALVIGTGDLSELALGWATYNGDHMSMYGVNTSIPKTLVKHLVKWTAMNQMKDKARTILLDIVDTPISPELLPADKDGNIAQKTEEVVGPYELHDFFLFYTLRFGFTPSKIQFLAKEAFGKLYTEDTINHWLKIFIRRFFTQQFKRSCMPDGPKVGSVNLSPRGDWRMPSDADWSEWIENSNL